MSRFQSCLSYAVLDKWLAPWSGGTVVLKHTQLQGVISEARTEKLWKRKWYWFVALAVLGQTWYFIPFHGAHRFLFNRIPAVSPRTGRHTSAPCSLQTNTLVSHLMNSVLGPKQLLELLTGNNIDCHFHAAVRLILLNQTDTAEDISVHVMSLFKCVQ